MAISPVAGRAGKRRNPVIVWLLLPIVTLGIYAWVWYYKVNRETRDLGVTVSPGISLLAITLGSFILVPPFVSFFKTGERIAQAQRSAGVAATCNPVVGLLLWAFLFGSGTLYYQSELNKIWDHYGNLPEGSPIAIAAGYQQAIGYQPQGNLPAGEPQSYQPSEHQPSEHQPSEHQPSEHQPSEHQPSEHQHPGYQDPGYQQRGFQQPGDERPEDPQRGY